MHCMAGVHQAAVLAALARMVCLGETWTMARVGIESVRAVDIKGALPRMNKGHVTLATLKQICLNAATRPEGPPAMKKWAAWRGVTHAVSEAQSGGWMPLCAWKQKKGGGPSSKPTAEFGLKEETNWTMEIIRAAPTLLLLGLFVFAMRSAKNMTDGDGGGLGKAFKIGGNKAKKVVHCACVCIFT